MNFAQTNELAQNPAFDGDVTPLRLLQSAGQHERALSLATKWLVTAPENRDLLLIKASALRHLGKTEEALSCLQVLASNQPRYSLAHEERGLCHIARRDAPAAIDSLLTAVNINPALPRAWRMLEGVYRLIGDTTNAGIAAEHVRLLAGLPNEVVTATSLFSDGDLESAEAIIRQFLLKYGDHPEAMRILAKVGIASKVYDDAEVLLAAVLEIVPGHRAARFEYAQALAYRQKFFEAKRALAPLLEQDPERHDFRTLASTIAVGLGHHGQAIELYHGMLADLKNNPAAGEAAVSRARSYEEADLNLWLGHALKTIGNQAAAIDAYRASAAARPDFGDAYWSLANLKRYSFTDLEIEAAEAAAKSRETDEVDRIHLCFALGKAFEDRRSHEQSWSWYERGNALKNRASGYRPEIIEKNAQLQHQICTTEFFQRRQGFGVADRSPIFVVGLPRSGSTLIEQILASHSKIEGTQELPNIQQIVQELQGRDPDLDNPRYPGALLDMDQASFARLGRRYLDETSVYRTGKRYFIDKMPNNFRHIGLIHLMLPNATIIDARREPMACCFSNLKQLFAQGQEFTYSIESIARYYRSYLDLMDHWDQVLPGRVLRVQHEDVIADLESSVARILDHCGLEFEVSCLEFHRTQRSVRTPSSEQVRQPIFRDGLDQWKNYERWLTPLHDALGDALTRYR